MPRRRLFIALSGIDGSGKTTQIAMLEQKLREARFDTRIVWCRWRPISSLPILSIFYRLGYARIYPTSSIGFVETRIPRNSGLASLWCFLIQLDNLLKNGLKVIIPLLLRRTVICDRYVLDLLVDAMGDLHDGPATKRIGYRLLHLMPRPDHAFVITIEPEVAFARKPDMPTISHFVERERLYSQMADKMRVEKLDGLLSPAAIHQKIWESLSKLVAS